MVNTEETTNRIKYALFLDQGRVWRSERLFVLPETEHNMTIV